MDDALLVVIDIRRREGRVGPQASTSRRVARLEALQRRGAGETRRNRASLADGCLLKKLGSAHRRLWNEGTYRLWPAQHANVEIPQAQPAVLADAAEPVVLVIASPRVKRHRGNPGLMALAASDDGVVDNRPDGDQVILSACKNILAVRRPAHADQTAVVRVVKVEQPGLLSMSSLRLGIAETHSSFK